MVFGMNIQHSSRNDSWRTPLHVVELVHSVFGGPPDLDPASDPDANAAMRSRRILTREDDALVCPWDAAGCSVYLNPPGGKLAGKSVVRLFWRRLMEHRGEFRHAIFAMFSIEGLQTTQGDHPAAMDFPICVPAKRVRWVDPTAAARTSPSQSNAFVYVPGTFDGTAEFVHHFGKLGKVKV